MPTYEYECTKCNKKFEAFQRMTENPLDKCPHCGGKPKRMISSGSGIIFKGSGFYETDYKKKSGKTPKSSPRPSCPNGCDGCGMKNE